MKLHKPPGSENNKTCGLPTLILAKAGSKLLRISNHMNGECSAYRILIACTSKFISTATFSRTSAIFFISDTSALHSTEYFYCL